MHIPSNEGNTVEVGVTSFGWLYCTNCRKSLRNRNNLSEYPDICPLCKSTLDYSFLDELKSEPFEIEEERTE